MALATQSPATRRAARRGKKLLKRNLPPGLYDAVGAIAKTSSDTDTFWALAGTLAAIAVGLERGFLQSGTYVRDFTWQLHGVLNGEINKQETREARGIESSFEDFRPWLGERIAAEDTSDTGPTFDVRPTLFNWIDVANQRLTLRRYARPDQIEHHARALIWRPIELTREKVASGTDKNKPSTEGSLASPDGGDIGFAVLVIRFFDLLDVERQSTMGRNRIRAAEADDVAGFYGVSEEVMPPSGEEERHACETFLEDLKAMDAKRIERVHMTIIEAMGKAVREKLGGGTWPQSFRMKSPRERLTWLIRRQVRAGK